MSETKSIRVDIPFTGSVSVMIEVPADVEPSEYLELALDQADVRVRDSKDGVTVVNQLEFHRYVTQGNVCHASLNQWDWSEE